MSNQYWGSAQQLVDYCALQTGGRLSMSLRDRLISEIAEVLRKTSSDAHEAGQAAMREQSVAVVTGWLNLAQSERGAESEGAYWFGKIIEQIRALEVGHGA